jgi:prepilin-type N-terminal cleavage/methylation domain-containing protein
MKILRSRAGYSLPEMMIAVAILGILALVGPPMMIGMQNFFLITSARTETQRDARACLSDINRFLRQAQASTVVIDSAANQGPYSRITFTLVDGRQMRFSQTGNKLIQELKPVSGAISSVTMTKNLSYIAFTYPATDDVSIISVAITMSKNIQLGKSKVLELTVQKVRIMNS